MYCYQTVSKYDDLKERMSLCAQHFSSDESITFSLSASFIPLLKNTIILILLSNAYVYRMPYIQVSVDALVYVCEHDRSYIPDLSL